MAVPQRLDALLGAAASLLELGGLHGGGASPYRLAGLRVRVQHPPGGLARALVLHSHEAVVQGEVVPDGVLRERKRKGWF